MEREWFIFFPEVLLIALGIYFKVFPISSPQERGWRKGFETPSAFLSQKHWDYSQKLGPNIVIATECICLVVVILLCFTSITNEKMILISFIISMLSFFVSMLLLENKLKKV